MGGVEQCLELDRGQSIGARRGVFILTRCRLHRLAHVDRVTGEAVRRYQHPDPGDLLHVDAKKLDSIPEGGGWPFTVPPMSLTTTRAPRAARGGRSGYGEMMVRVAMENLPFQRR
mgnify:CR=1 FL=1